MNEDRETLWDRDARAVTAAILTNQRGQKNEVPDAKSVASYAGVVADALAAERLRRYEARELAPLPDELAKQVAELADAFQDPRPPDKRTPITSKAKRAP